MAPEELQAQLEHDVHEALKLWRSSDTTDSPLSHLRLFRYAYIKSTGNVRQATNEILLKAIEALAVDHAKHATLLRKRFLDGMVMYAVANSLNMAESTAFRMQKEALKHLALILYNQEIHARQEHQQHLHRRLEPPTYTLLVGIEGHLDHLLDLLTSVTPPWLISIAGLGGIGKTSLADALSRQLIDTDLFDDFAWISARQQVLNLGGGLKSVDMPALTIDDLVAKLAAQLLPDLSRSTVFSTQKALDALRTKLKQGPHVIVIDNLETVADVENLLPILRDLVQPTRFLLTSRKSLHYESGVYHFALPELTESDALRLIRHEAQLHNLPYLNQASDESLRRIYETVGGNPLALRLVVGQTHIHALDQVLTDLQAARGQKAEMLYHFIYRQAWDRLDTVTRQVFLCMPLVTQQGGDLDHLGYLTGLEPTVLRDTLEHLVTLNLVDSQGNLTERRYTIHNLTRTFLQEQVAKWD
jgi:hypothetical protein